MSIKWISGGGLDNDNDDTPARTSYRSQRVRENEQFLAQLNGGEPSDFTAEAERLEPHAPKPYYDDDLTNSGFEPVKYYKYTDLDGKLLYEAVRYQHKTVRGIKKFRQRRPGSGNSASWIADAGLVKVPYRWPDLITRPEEQIFFCEGEKDADRLAELGLLATTIAGQNWSETVADALSGRDVVILEDNDEKGRANAQKSADALEGRTKSVRVIRLPQLKYKGDVSDWLDAGHTKDELLAYARDSRPTGASSDPYQFPDEKDISMWDWLYGKHLLRGTVSGTAASGGTGKTTKSIVEALAMASGKPLLAERVPRPLRVLLINLEDDRNTMNKRIAAAMRLHRLTKDDIADCLFVIAKGERKLKLVRTGKSGQLEYNDRDIAWLTSYLIERKIDVVSIDPLIKTHGVNENDNEKMSALIEIYDDIAVRTNCAISLWHHTRKGNGGDVTVESARGAGALVDACRAVRVLETMSKKEAEAAGIDVQQHRFYFKEFSGKLNFSPPVDQVKWCRLHNIELDNGGHLFGDEVGAVSSWTHPGVDTVNLTPDKIAEIKQAVSNGRWRKDSQAAMWVGWAIGPVLGLTDKEPIKAVVRQLMRLGVLKDDPGQDERRRDRMFVIVGEPRPAPPSAGGAGFEDPI
jgi:5S rRNA maturation endonuclease (ribonuclease M5)